MPDNESRRPEDWYRNGTLETAEADSWYGGSSDAVSAWPADAGCSTQKPPSRAAGFSAAADKKRRRTKIISLSVCAFVLVCAAALAVWRIANRMQVRIVANTAERPVIVVPGGPDSGDYEDYRDYFASNYRRSDEIGIPRAATGTGVTLTLRPRSGEELSLQDIYDAVSPAVVGLTTYRDGVRYAWGTGVVFTSDGYMITNTHVLENADAAVVIFPDGETCDASLVGADTASDIAVMKLDGEDFPYAQFGDSDELRVGDPAAAIGNPLGEAYAGTMTDGIISAINRDIMRDGYRMTLLQTNAAINEGNSGGPLVNAYGQVIGITNMKIMTAAYTTVEGIGFAVPSAVVKKVADELIAGGVVTGEPTIGITAAAVSEEAMERYGLPAGVYVADVNEGSDALDKDLRVGDIILAVNGTPVATVAEVNALKDGLTVGDAITLTVYREGEGTFDMDIVLVDKSVLR